MKKINKKKEREFFSSPQKLTTSTSTSSTKQVDRKLLLRDWRPRLAALQQQASNAARELSAEHAELLRSPWEEKEEAKISSSVVDHPAALRIRDALISSPETATKSLLGAWTGQAGTWDKICRAYARGGNAAAGKGVVGLVSSSSTEGCSLAVAEAALSLTKAVDFEIPALRASTSKGHQTLRDLERRAAEAERQAVAAAKEYRSERASLGIRSVSSSSSSSSSSVSEPAASAVETELRELVRRELRPMLRSALEALKSEAVSAGVEHYSSFVRYAHHGSSSSSPSSADKVLLPALAEARSAVLEEEKEEEKPAEEETTSEAARATAAAEDESGGISWDIDVSSSGADATAAAPPSSGSVGEIGGISWDIETVAGAEDDEGVDSTTSPIVVDNVENKSKNDNDVLSKLASDASARASLGDDIAELSAFLSQRLAAVKGGGSTFLPPDAPSDLSSFYASPSSSSETIQAALEGLRSAEESLSGDRASTLHLLKNPAGKGFERLAARLRSKAGAEGKFRALAAAASLRAEDVRRELAVDAKNLRRAAAAARDARARTEAMISAIISKSGERARKVNVVGEVSAAISAAEAATGG